MTRSRMSVVVTAVAVAPLLGALLVGSAAPGAATPARSTTSSVAGGDVVVGHLTLHPCPVLKHTLCGSVLRPWDPTGAIPGNIRVGFAFLPARDHSRAALGTLVPRVRRKRAH